MGRTMGEVKAKNKPGPGCAWSKRLLSFHGDLGTSLWTSRAAPREVVSQDTAEHRKGKRQAVSALNETPHTEHPDEDFSMLPNSQT